MIEKDFKFSPSHPIVNEKFFFSKLWIIVKQDFSRRQSEGNSMSMLSQRNYFSTPFLSFPFFFPFFILDLNMHNPFVFSQSFLSANPGEITLADDNSSLWPAASQPRDGSAQKS